AVQPRAGVVHGAIKRVGHRNILLTKG
ncbi:MAG: hypothetical protein ACI9NG_003040, partial [Hyphomonas sp.]